MCVDARVSGRMRLMVMAQGKNPEPLLKTQEESAAPMTAVAGNRIAFAVGPEPRETIAVADTATGRVSGRISPGKGVIQTLAASADGETLYFTASGSVWSVATAGGEPRRICPGSGCSFIPLAASSWPEMTARRCACSRSSWRTERSAPSP